MIIRVRSSVATWRLEVPSDATLLDLKEMIFKKYGIPVEQQSLTLDLQGQRPLVKLGATGGDATATSQQTLDNTKLSDLGDEPSSSGGGGIKHGDMLYLAGRLERQTVDRSYVGDRGEVVQAGTNFKAVETPSPNINTSASPAPAAPSGSMPASAAASPSPSPGPGHGHGHKSNTPAAATAGDASFSGVAEKDNATDAKPREEVDPEADAKAWAAIYAQDDLNNAAAAGGTGADGSGDVEEDGMRKPDEAKQMRLLGGDDSDSDSEGHRPLFPTTGARAGVGGMRRFGTTLGGSSTSGADLGRMTAAERIEVYRNRYNRDLGISVDISGLLASVDGALSPPLPHPFTGVPPSPGTANASSSGLSADLRASLKAAGMTDEELDLAMAASASPVRTDTKREKKERRGSGSGTGSDNDSDSSCASGGGDITGRIGGGSGSGSGSGSRSQDADNAGSRILSASSSAHQAEGEDATDDEALLAAAIAESLRLSTPSPSANASTSRETEPKNAADRGRKPPVRPPPTAPPMSTSTTSRSGHGAASVSSAADSAIRAMAANREKIGATGGSGQQQKQQRDRSSQGNITAATSKSSSSSGNLVAQVRNGPAPTTPPSASDRKESAQHPSAASPGSLEVCDPEEQLMVDEMAELGFGREDIALMLREAREQKKQEKRTQQPASSSLAAVAKAAKAVAKSRRAVEAETPAMAPLPRTGPAFGSTQPFAHPGSNPMRSGSSRAVDFGSKPTPTGTSPLSVAGSRVVSSGAGGANTSVSSSSRSSTMRSTTSTTTTTTPSAMTTATTTTAVDSRSSRQTAAARRRERMGLASGGTGAGAGAGGTVSGTANRPSSTASSERFLPHANRFDLHDSDEEAATATASESDLGGASALGAAAEDVELAQAIAMSMKTAEGGSGGGAPVGVGTGPVVSEQRASAVPGAAADVASMALSDDELTALLERGGLDALLRQSTARVEAVRADADSDDDDDDAVPHSMDMRGLHGVAPQVPPRPAIGSADSSARGSSTTAVQGAAVRANVEVVDDEDFQAMLEAALRESLEQSK